MNILLLDTGFNTAQAGVWQNGALQAQAQSTDSKHDQSLPLLVQQVLDDAGVNFADLTALAVNIGPGRFTSLRVGLAYARGLALALNVPIYSYTSWQLLRQGDEALVLAIKPGVLDVQLQANAPSVRFELDDVVLQNLSNVRGVFAAHMLPQADGTCLPSLQKLGALAVADIQAGVKPLPPEVLYEADNWSVAV